MLGRHLNNVKFDNRNQNIGFYFSISCVTTFKIELNCSKTKTDVRYVSYLNAFGITATIYVYYCVKRQCGTLN